MNELMNNEFNMTSLEVVELVNSLRKEEGNEKVKRHDVFLRDIRNEVNALSKLNIDAHNFVEVEYIDAKGEKRPCYQLNKQGIMQMLNKESAYVRYKTQQYIEALENKIKEQQTLLNPSYAIADPIKRAERWIEEQKEKLMIEQERDQLQIELDESKDYYSIKRVAFANNISWKEIDWRKLKRESHLQGKDVVKIFDANYGEVNTYHRTVWEVIYPTLILK